MDNDNIFIENNLPPVLFYKETNEYFKMMQSGDASARNIIILHHIQLVKDIIISKYQNTIYDNQELFSIGLIGLIKSVDDYDLNMKLKFSTLAKKYINKEIIKFIEKNQNATDCESLNRLIFEGNRNDKTIVEDRLNKTSDVISDYEDKELCQIVRNIVNSLDEKDRFIMLKYFGFDGSTMIQKEIGKLFQVSHTTISSVIKSNLKKISIELKRLDIIDSIPKRLIKENNKNI